jgi:hypothetical protein
MSKEFCDFALDTFFRTEALVFAAGKKIQPAKVMQFFVLSKQEHERIDPLAGRVLAKWVPEWLAKFEDEVALAGLLINVSIAKFAIASATVNELRKREKENAGSGNGEVRQPASAAPVYVETPAGSVNLNA